MSGGFHRSPRLRFARWIVTGGGCLWPALLGGRREWSSRGIGESYPETGDTGAEEDRSLGAAAKNNTNNFKFLKAVLRFLTRSVSGPTDKICYQTSRFLLSLATFLPVGDLSHQQMDPAITNFPSLSQSALNALVYFPVPLRLLKEYVNVGNKCVHHLWFSESTIKQF